MTEYRKGLPDRPRRIALLPLSDKGYPIPWFVDLLPDGTRDFRIMDPNKWVRAVRDRLCWVCGEKMTGPMVFVAGPMCGVNRTSGEPPCHHDCAEYAARACPFLTLPKAIRRDAGLDGIPHTVNVGHLDRNPGVTLLWTTTSYKVFSPAPGRRLIEMGEPTRVEYFAQGRHATREEVIESVESGLPLLEALANEGGPDAVQELHAAAERFATLLPASKSAPP